MASNLNEFREELKGKIFDFATVYQVSSSYPKIEKSYEKLEKFILETYNSWMIDSNRKIEVPEAKENPEDTTLQLDF